VKKWSPLPRCSREALFSSFRRFIPLTFPLLLLTSLSNLALGSFLSGSAAFLNRGMRAGCRVAYWQSIWAYCRYDVTRLTLIIASSVTKCNVTDVDPYDCNAVYLYYRIIIFYTINSCLSINVKSNSNNAARGYSVEMSWVELRWTEMRWKQ